MAVKRKHPAAKATTKVPAKKPKAGYEAPSALPRNGDRKSRRKESAFDRKFIEIPAAKFSDDDEGAVSSDQDLELLQGASFLKNFDYRGIAKSKKEIQRLRQLHRPVHSGRRSDSIPALDSSDEENEDETIASHFTQQVNKDLEGIPSSEDEDVSTDPNAEMPYEQIPRKKRLSWGDKNDVRGKKIEGLPTKLPDGTIQKSTKVLVMSNSEQSSEQESDDEFGLRVPESRTEDVAAARFGRAAVVDIIGKPSRRDRVEAAKEQIASICQEILAEPENSLGLLRRLHTFSLRDISASTQPKPIPNDPIIRKLTYLSQLAIFKDIIPGYRIRPLTDKEKAEKVSSTVARTREWEQGLVTVYQSYLRSLETETQERTELAEVALSCMCTLLEEVTHFNFSVNLISCIVARLSRKSWDKSSELCMTTIIKVFREDLTGVPSLEIVRMLNRMIKEKQFSVHPNVLSCLSHLRLRAELGLRASDTRAEKDEPSRKNKGHRKGMKSDPLHISKKTKKALKEKKVIEKEMREAEAEVDKEERANTQTETLKLLFALYFRILKNHRPTPLLSAALTGIARFAHLVNIDFFRDLMEVLKGLISLEVDDSSEVGGAVEPVEDYKYTRHRLQCIVTAFDLLSGQGEALNIDLSDFITQLYSMILPLTLVYDIESPSQASRNHSTTHTGSARPSNSSNHTACPLKWAQPTISPLPSISDLLFRALYTVFTSQTTGGTTAPPWRSAAFAKRLLTAALHWPPSSALRTLEFVHSLIVKDPKLEALLSTEDRILDGIYRPDVDDPQLCHPYGTGFWELQTLASHLDPGVRGAAEKILSYNQ